MTIIHTSAMEPTSNVEEADAASAAASTSENIDEESVRGRFGWIQIAGVDVPYIIRTGQPHIAIRMIKNTILDKIDTYLKCLNKKVYEIAQVLVNSQYVTEAEMHLLNEINAQHCDYMYGPASVIRSNDLVVKADDISEFHKYVVYCYEKFSNYPGYEDKSYCGFIKINAEFVPYTTEGSEKVVPLFYFEVGPTSIMQHAHPLTGWALVYLKFLLTIQGIRKEFFTDNSMLVVNLSIIQDLFPSGTAFDYKWPTLASPSSLRKPSGNDEGPYMFSWMNKPEGVPWNQAPTSRQTGNQNGIPNSQGGTSPGSYPFRNYQPHNAVSISTKTGNQNTNNQTNCNQPTHNQRSRPNQSQSSGSAAGSTESTKDRGLKPLENMHKESTCNLRPRNRPQRAGPASSKSSAEACSSKTYNGYRGSCSSGRSVSLRRQVELSTPSTCSTT